MASRAGPASSRQGRVLAACSIGAALGYGTLGVAMFGQFVMPLSAKLGRSTDEVSLAFSVMTAGSVLGPPIAGGLIDRFGARTVATVSALLMGVTFMILACANTLAQVYVLYGLVSLAGSGTLVVTYSRPIVAMFTSRRGSALGIILAAVGAATAVLPPILASVNDAADPSAGFILLGAISVAAATCAAAYLPHQSIISPVDRPKFRTRWSEVATHAGSSTGIKLIAAGFVLGAFTSGVWGQAVPLMRGKGISAIDAAGAMTAMAIVLTLTRLAAGFAMDRVFAPWLGAALLAIVCLAWLGFGLTTSRTTAMIAVAVLGLGVGVEFDLFSYLLSKYLPRHIYASFYGLIYSAISLGLAAGGPAISFAKVGLKSPEIAPFVLAAATAFAVCLLLSLPGYCDDEAASDGFGELGDDGSATPRTRN